MLQDSVEAQKASAAVLVINRYSTELAKAAVKAFSDSSEIRVVVDRRTGERQMDADRVADEDLDDLFLEC
jgi:hypothetical protein